MAERVATEVTIQTCADYIDDMLGGIQSAPPGDFLLWPDDLADREHLYRSFLIQSSSDLLAEALASALGVIGEYGPPQSALFRILIDEFGHGVQDKTQRALPQNHARIWFIRTV